MRSLCLAFVTLVCGSPPIMAAADEVSQQAFRQEQAAEGHFRSYINDCAEDEIRCVWFSDDRNNVGVIMTLKLKPEEVYTVTDVYSWARQSAGTRKLNHSQALAAMEAAMSLPEGPADVPFAKALHITFWQDKKLHAVAYPRQAVPRTVQRLYDVGGGRSGFTYLK